VHVRNEMTLGPNRPFYRYGLVTNKLQHGPYVVDGSVPNILQISIQFGAMHRQTVFIILSLIFMLNIILYTSGRVYFHFAALKTKLQLFNLYYEL